MNRQDRRKNENEASEVGEAFPLPPPKWRGPGGIRLYRAAIWNWRRLRPRALPLSTGFGLDATPTLARGAGRTQLAKFVRPFWLAASRSPSPPGPLPQGEGTPQPALRRVGALWIGESAAAIRPLPKGEGRGEG